MDWPPPWPFVASHPLTAQMADELHSQLQSIPSTSWRRDSRIILRSNKKDTVPKCLGFGLTCHKCTPCMTIGQASYAFPELRASLTAAANQFPDKNFRFTSIHITKDVKTSGGDEYKELTENDKALILNFIKFHNSRKTTKAGILVNICGNNYLSRD